MTWKKILFANFLLWQKLKDSLDMMRQKYLYALAVFVSQHTDIYGDMNEKGGEFMVAMLWANQIILGKKTYAQVPRLLKEQVKEILIDSGMEELVTE